MTRKRKDLRLEVRIDAALEKMLRKKAKERGITVSELVRDVLALKAA